MDRQSFEDGIFLLFLFLEGTFFDFEGKSLIKTLKNSFPHKFCGSSNNIAFTPQNSSARVASAFVSARNILQHCLTVAARPGTGRLPFKLLFCCELCSGRLFLC